MAKPKNQKSKHQRPPRSVYDSMDELVLIPIETVLENMDIPLFSDDEFTKFTADEESVEIMKTDGSGRIARIGNMTLRLPELFQKIYTKTVMGELLQCVVIKDKGSSIQFTCYDYMDDEAEMAGMLKRTGEILGTALNNDYLWSYEMIGREINLEPVFTKDGTYFCVELASGTLRINRNHPTFAPIYSAMRDKRNSRWNEFYHKASLIKDDPSWRETDIVVLYDMDLEYSERMVGAALSVDMALFMIQYAFTMHMIANAKIYGIEYEDAPAGNIPAASASGSTSQSGIKKGRSVHRVNIDLSGKQLKRERTRRAKQAAKYSTKEWSVRGFKRRYKSGKEVWISPTTHKRKDGLLSGNEKSVRKYEVKI